MLIWLLLCLLSLLLVRPIKVVIADFFGWQMPRKLFIISLISAVVLGPISIIWQFALLTYAFRNKP
jgi:hypothetical protein